MGLFNLFRKKIDNDVQLNNLKASKLYRYTQQLDELCDRWTKLKHNIDDSSSAKDVASKVALELERKKLEAAVIARLTYIGSRL